MKLTILKLLVSILAAMTIYTALAVGSLFMLRPVNLAFATMHSPSAFKPLSGLFMPLPWRDDLALYIIKNRGLTELDNDITNQEGLTASSFLGALPLVFPDITVEKQIRLTTNLLHMGLDPNKVDSIGCSPLQALLVINGSYSINLREKVIFLKDNGATWLGDGSNLEEDEAVTKVCTKENMAHYIEMNPDVWKIISN